MQVVIQDSNLKWTSKDGNRRIYEVTYTNGAGTLLVRKTFSDVLGKGKGQSFDVEEYSRDGNQGPEQFVKQVETNSSGYGQNSSGGGQSSSSQERQFKADPEKQSSIERQSALKSAVEAVSARGINPNSPYPSLDDYAEGILSVANKFVSFVSGTPAAIAAVMPGAQAVEQPPVESYEPPVQDSMV